MTDRETYLARAAEARSDADAARLDNVRERCLRSAEAWNAMATRAERTEKMRATLQAHKAGESGSGELSGPEDAAANPLAIRQ